jgi:hypothetical protein
METHTKSQSDRFKVAAASIHVAKAAVLLEELVEASGSRELVEMATDLLFKLDELQDLLDEAATAAKADFVVGEKVLARCQGFADKSGWSVSPELPWAEFRIRAAGVFGSYYQIETLDGDVVGLPFRHDDLARATEKV